jgi:L-ascorbate metabolism protein UlaG (beta-lactamase superfamily)
MALGVLVGVVIVSCAYLYRLVSPSSDVADYSIHLRDDLREPGEGEVAVTFFGVSTLLFDDGETQLLVDAFFSRPSKIELLTTMTSDGVAVESALSDYGIDRLEAVFVAHSHFDHALDVAEVARRTSAMVYGTSSTVNIGLGGGADPSRLVAVDSGDVLQVGAFTVRVVESPHSPPPGGEAPSDPETIDRPLEQPASNADFAEGGNFSFVVSHGDRTFVAVASANYRPGFLAGTDADVLFLGTARLGVADEVFQDRYLAETVEQTSPEMVVPLHWDDFTIPWQHGKARFNPRLIDPNPAGGFERVVAEAERIGAEFVLLQAGSRLIVNPD